MEVFDYFTHGVRDSTWLLGWYTLATVCLVLAAGWALRFARRQAEETRRNSETARHMLGWDIAKPIIQELRSDEWRLLQQGLCTIPLEPDQIAESLDAADRGERQPEVDGVLVPADPDPRWKLLISRQQQLGVLLRNGVVDRNLLFDMVGATPLRSWYMLGPYVKKRWEQEGNQYYASGFRSLALEALRWYRCRSPEQEWPTLDRGKPGVDPIRLVEVIAEEDLIGYK